MAERATRKGNPYKPMWCCRKEKMQLAIDEEENATITTNPKIPIKLYFTVVKTKETI